MLRRALPWFAAVFLVGSLVVWRSMPDEPDAATVRRALTIRRARPDLELAVSRPLTTDLGSSSVRKYSALSKRASPSSRSIDSWNRAMVRMRADPKYERLELLPTDGRRRGATADR